MSKKLLIRKSAGGVVLNTERKIALTEQSRKTWSFPKGGIDAGETPLTAALRECYEEVGLSSDMLQHIKAFPMYIRDAAQEGETVEKHMYLFLFTTEYTGDLVPIDPANPSAAWFDIEAVTKQLFHEKDRAFFESIKHEL